MAMGVSTERNPFKPCTPSPLWFVQPPIMTQPIVPSSTSSHPFSFSLEPFHRRDLHLLHGANSLSPVITLLRSRGLITCSRSFSTEDARYIDCGRQDYQSPTYSKLALWLEQNSLSRSPYRMLPGYIYLKRVLREQHRRSIVYAQKVASGGSVRLKVMDQENKTINRYFHEELVRDIEDVSLSRFRNYRSPRSTFPGVKGNRNDWVGEADKIKQERPSTSKDVLASHVKTDGPHLRSRNGNSKIGSYIFRQDQGRCSVLSGDLPNDTDEISSPKAKTNAILNAFNETHIEPILTGEECIIRQAEHRKRLSRIYEKVLVVDNISVAKEIVKLLITKYSHFVHACDTEVAKIDARHETPVGHGEMICFSIFSGEGANFGGGKSCIWVDVLDGGGREVLMEFAPFFENPSIKKVWHNYSFDNHIIENYGLKISGFHADTMHMARLWDSSRQIDGGYSLEALTSDPKVMSGKDLGKKKVMSMGGDLIGKISMRTIFGKKKLKKDGDEGKIIIIAPVEELQREERLLWICYSALDSISTLKLFESLKAKLMAMDWNLDESHRGSMYDFYEQYWRPFGELLVKVETEGMLVNRAYLAEVEKVAVSEREVAGNKFRKWASRYCHDALYMNVGSDAQLRQLFFGGMVNRNDETKALPKEKSFKVPNVEKMIEKGKKVAMKFRNITLSKIGERIETEVFTATGWPSVSVDVLNVLAGKVSSEYNWNGEIYNPTLHKDESDFLSYGTAYAAFGGGKEGREACHAIAALREVCSIGSLISYFILPLQSNNISGKTGRIHCSLNINTETGRLSARRPNLQNQPALEKDRYRIRQAFVAAPGNSLIIADYGQLELRILAHLTNCKSMLEAFKAGGDFHSRTAMNMYPHIREAVENKQVLLEWHPNPGEEIPPVPLLKDAFASERRKAKMLNFSIAYGKTPVGLARDWKVSVQEARKTVHLWYKQRQEVLSWQKERKKEATTDNRVYTLLGRARTFPSMATTATRAHKSHIERAAINTPVQGSAADVAMCAMLEISSNARLKELGWRLLLQIHDELILEGPTEFAEEAKGIIVHCMTKPFHGSNFLKVDLSVDVKSVQNWFAAK